MFTLLHTLGKMLVNVSVRFWVVGTNQSTQRKTWRICTSCVEGAS